MNIESMNIDKESVERPEDVWIERFSSWLVGGLVYRLLPGKWGKEVNGFISTVIGYDLKKLASLPPKMFNNLLYDLFYEKQYKEYWNSNRGEVSRKILRQAKLFGINAKLSNLDIDAYLQQWIEGHFKEAMEIPEMIETALEHSQMLLGEAKGGDIIEYYKNQVLALMNWKEIYSRAYDSVADQKHNPEIPRIATGSGTKQRQIDSVKSNENKILINDTSLSYSISDLNVNEADLKKGFSLFLDNYETLGDIMSSLNLPMDVSSILGDTYANDMPGFSLFQSAGSSAGSGFTMGCGIEVPLDFQINVTGTEKLDTLNQTIAEASDSILQVDETTVSATDTIIEQYQNLTVEQVSLNTSIAALNFSGIGMPFINISTSVEDAGKKAVVFSDTLSDIARYAREIGGAFMGVNEEICKAIGSAGTLTEGISGIFKAFEGDEVNGLGLMQGIQGGFAGLQGLFGGEAGSDMSELLGGIGGLGAGAAGLLTGNPLEGIASIISSLPSFIDGLTESTQEGYEKQLSKQGFNDNYSEGLLDKMSAVSDQKGDKSLGIKAYIEDFFKETNIDTNEEFSRMSDLLNESIGEYVAQGHTMDEAYGKFGDELERLTAAQEKYGFETVSSLTNMLDIQKSQTKEGRIEGLQGSLGGYDKIISGIEQQMKLTPDFKLSETSISGIAGSLTNTYQELLNQGMGAGEAVDAVKPLLTEYAGMAEKQGWDLSKVPGFSQLSSYFDSLDKASGALDMIQGSADVVKALSGSGLMDQATLESQGSLGLDVMRQLEASGLNDTQMLQQMGGWLQSMQEASEKWGLSLSPEIQALITQAEEKGVLPEEAKPIDEVIAGGIETGFTKAIDVIDKYFGGLVEYGEGGMVPGLSGQKKLIFAHAGEAVGYPAELSKLVSNPESAQGLSGVAGILAAAMRNAGAMLSAAGGGTESIVATLQNLADSNKLDLEEMQSNNMINSPLNDYAHAQDMVVRQTNNEIEQKVAAERQAAAESNKLEIAQTIENRMKIAVNGRDFVNAIKQDIYDQLKEDSRRGMITIHDSAIKKY